MKKAFIASYDNSKASIFGHAQELTISKEVPSHVTRGRGVVTGQQPSKPVVEVVIEKDTHYEARSIPYCSRARFISHRKTRRACSSVTPGNPSKKSLTGSPS